MADHQISEYDRVIARNIMAIGRIIVSMNSIGIPILNKHILQSTETDWCLVILAPLISIAASISFQNDTLRLNCDEK